jgi:hypothetical protein
MPFSGNARQHADNSIAVLDALQLVQCWQELKNLYEKSRLRPSDCRKGQIPFYRKHGSGTNTDEARCWIKAAIMGDKAVRVLRVAISSGDLPLWRIQEAHEVPVAAPDLEPRSIRTGVFQTFERPVALEDGTIKLPEMQGALLWVKRVDWERFLSARSGKVRPKANADRECAKWLTSEFQKGIGCKQSKESFKQQALQLFNGRLSVRGFLRAWDSVAPKAGRSKPGRKS